MTTLPAVLAWSKRILLAVEGTTLDPALVASVIHRESNGVPTAINPSGAAGLTQIIPRHHRDLVARVAGLPPKATDAELTEALFRPEVAIEAGVLHLSWCVRNCGDEAKGLAKYHTGSCVAGAKADSAGTPTRDYVADIMNLRNEYRPHFTPVLPPIVVTPGPLTFGRVPHPDFIDKIVPKPPGAGYTEVSPRHNVGTCVHYWGGNAWTTPRWKSIYDLFTGERLWDALTDYSIQQDGSIVRLNDPRGTRSPYASGGSDPLAGDGPAFVKTFGSGAINSKLVSIECEDDGSGLTPEQLESLASLVAYWHDNDEVTWSAFPLHQKYSIVTQLQHNETGKRQCPGRGVVSQTNEYQNRARQIMKKYQTGTGGDTVAIPPPSPITPVVPYSSAKDQKFLRSKFGGATIYDTAGDITGIATYDPTGVISTAWVQRCDAEDVWPNAESWRTGMPGPISEWVEFSNGWHLVNLGEKGGWKWAGREV